MKRYTLNTYVKKTIVVLFIVQMFTISIQNKLSLPTEDNNANVDIPVGNETQKKDEFEIYLDTAIWIMQNEMRNSANVPKYLNVFGTKNMAWCTEFVVWSLLEADKQLNTNYVTTLYPLLDTGNKASKWFSKNNRLHKEKDYIPKRGDFMFFKYYDSIVDHTAFVVGIKQIDGITYVHTIEGNIPSLKDKSIQERILPLNDKAIYGYGSYE